MKKLNWKKILKRAYKEPLQDIIEHCSKNNIRVRFGLVNQGLIPKVSDMIDNGYSWEFIAEKINWCPETLKKSYIKYLQNLIYDLFKRMDDKHNYEMIAVSTGIGILPVLKRYIYILEKEKNKTK